MRLMEGNASTALFDPVMPDDRCYHSVHNCFCILRCIRELNTSILIIKVSMINSECDGGEVRL